MTFLTASALCIVQIIKCQLAHRLNSDIEIAKLLHEHHRCEHVSMLVLCLSRKNKTISFKGWVKTRWSQMDQYEHVGGHFYFKIYANETLT